MVSSDSVRRDPVRRDPVIPQGYRPGLIFWMGAIAVIVSVMLASKTGAETPPISAQFVNDYHALLEDYYRREHLAEAASLRYSDVASLHRNASKIVLHEPSSALKQIVANKQLIKENIDSEYTTWFLSTLLNHDLVVSANEIVSYVIDNASFETASQVQYQLGVYHYEQDNLQQAIEHLAAIDDQDALTEKQQDYATLIFGAVIQRNKQHRQALKVYQRIKESSYYYSYAQLNSAVANIRQGWWTDAHISIERALASDIPEALSDIANRLILVLAYSQLKNEFYRDARKTFGKISLDSRHVEKALLGLGLSALNQKDHHGAINAFSRLKQRSNDGLAVLEANLLVPYTYDKMGNKEKAAEGYANAISLFESKLFLIDAQLLSLKQAGQIPLNASLQSHLPQSLLRMKTHISRLEKKHITLNKKIANITASIDDEIAAHTKEFIIQRQTHIKSYISQSQYGLAKLYDNP